MAKPLHPALNFEIIADEPSPQTDGHDFYNHANYPVLFLREMCIDRETGELYPSNWEICAKADGSHFASIATQGGCKSTHYGSLDHIRHILRDCTSARTVYQFTQFAIDLLGDRFLEYVQRDDRPIW